MNLRKSQRSAQKNEEGQNVGEELTMGGGAGGHAVGGANIYLPPVPEGNSRVNGSQAIFQENNGELSRTNESCKPY